MPLGCRTSHAPLALALLLALLPAAPAAGGDVGCPKVPSTECFVSHDALLSIDERRPGNEKLKFDLNKVIASVTLDDFGDPVGRTTRFDLCIYDAGDAFVAGLPVDRGGQSCGGKPCWKATSKNFTLGYAYADKTGSASGFEEMQVKAFSQGVGQVKGAARNRAAKAQSALPNGIAPALQGATRARIQLFASDGACFEGIVDEVRRADGTRFKATGI